MNRFPYLLLIVTGQLIFLTAPHLSAQDAAKADPEDVKKAIAIVQDRVTRQMTRVSDLSKEITRLDTRIENSANRIVQDLSGLGDSTDSRTEVAKLKEKVMKGLKTSITKYQRTRSQVELTLKNTKSDQSKQDLKNDLKEFDHRIENRVGQIVNISRSLTTEQDFRAYEKHLRDTRYDGLYYHPDAKRKLSEEKVQNRRVTQVTDVQRQKVITALKQSITKLNNSNAGLRSQMNLKINSAQADIFQQDIESNLQAIVNREAQLDVMMRNEQTPTVPITRRVARETELMIQDEAISLRRDVDNLFRHYYEFQRERTQQNDLMQRLKELEAMLQ